MSKNCVGCGVKLQCEDENTDGYVDSKVFEDSIFCRRCFRLKNYGEYKASNKPNIYYRTIVDDVLKNKELVIHIVDIFNMGNIDCIYNKILYKAILVISKIDVFPKSVNKEKIIKYFKDRYPKYTDVICISSDKNYHFDELYNAIMKYKVSEEVYVIGNSNSGKSTFINKMIKNYTEKEDLIVTSCIPSTTLDVISIKLNDNLTLLDTPGIINEGDINTVVDENVIKLLNLKSEIKPRIYQIHKKSTLIFDNIGRINILNDSNISIYISNSIKINKVNFSKNISYTNLEAVNIIVNENEELAIDGLCFIKTSKETTFELYMPAGINIYKRTQIIG